jgi:hypothetical protein
MGRIRQHLVLGVVVLAGEVEFNPAVVAGLGRQIAVLRVGHRSRRWLPTRL